MNGVFENMIKIRKVEREGEREGKRERDRVQNEMTEEERMKNSESVKMKERMSDK